MKSERRCTNQRGNYWTVWNFLPSRKKRQVNPQKKGAKRVEDIWIVFIPMRAKIENHFSNLWKFFFLNDKSHQGGGTWV